MKKNTMMRLASVLLIAVLMSTCAISGTFAKYVTSDSGSDTARVAKFGVEITPNGKLFLKEYEKTDGTYTVSGNTVETSDSSNVIAPGTNYQLKEVRLAGAPEVAVRVTYEATIDLSNWNIGGVEYYCPLVVTVEGTNFYGMNYASESEFEAAIKAAIEACKKDYAPTQDLSATEVAKDAPSVSWAWAFEKGDSVNGLVCDKNDDVKDTALGDKAADGSEVKITITIKTTVTQID